MLRLCAQMSKVLEMLSDEDKECKILILLQVLRDLPSIGSAVTFWNSLDAVGADRELLVDCAVGMAQLVPHVCGVERVNKNAALVHTKLRASLGEVRTSKLTYVYTNLALTLPKSEKKPSLLDFCESVLEEDQIDELLALLEFSDGDDEAILPAGEASSSSDEEEEEEEAADVEEEDANEAAAVFVQPTGFKVLKKPADLLKSAAEIENLYVMMVWSLKDRKGRAFNQWEVGKVKRFMPARTLHNYDILWDDGMRGSKLTLRTYFLHTDDEQYIPQEGEWLYLRKA
ncbi:hypothetical protein CYMTET_21354 [Cymbomonas tetramitiformis]|uniref:Uncharacterized protein n=1 Tax=Cymbomonas tetramitiformis TaxID=36881 RepID=A0AAE0G278_9CHLO|nr:hypothetical protein CYMTET_21354 [Cymbomonas tetramitiformis]